MTEDDFMNNVLGKAQRLCSAEGDSLIGNKNFNRPTSKADADPESFGRSVNTKQDDSWDRMFLSEAAYEDNSPSVNREQKPREMPITPSSVSKSRVPDFIKESMLSNSIDTSSLSANPLDRMDLSRFHTGTTSLPKKQEPKLINELTATEPAIGGIDYPLIRAIVKECIEEKFKEYGLSKNLLNESTLKSIHLKGGKISIVDNSGNIYGANLKKEGNVNDK